MKQTLFTALVLFLGFNMNTHAQANKTKATKSKAGSVVQASMKEPVAYPYTAGYSSQFEMGKPELARMILGMFKGYEANDFSGDNPFADTAAVILSNGNVLKGKDLVSEAFQKSRAEVQNSRFHISAVMPVRSTDRGENWVLVWGTQEFTQANGSAAKQEFHNIWRINKDGKVDFAQFFEGKSPGSMQ